MLPISCAGHHLPRASGPGPGPGTHILRRGTGTNGVADKRFTGWRRAGGTAEVVAGAEAAILANVEMGRGSGNHVFARIPEFCKFSQVWFCKVSQGLQFFAFPDFARSRKVCARSRNSSFASFRKCTSDRLAGTCLMQVFASAQVTDSLSFARSRNGHFSDVILAVTYMLTRYITRSILFNEG